MELRTSIQHSLLAHCGHGVTSSPADGRDFLHGELNSKSVSLESRPFLSWSAGIRESEQQDKQLACLLCSQLSTATCRAITSTGHLTTDFTGTKTGWLGKTTSES